MDFRDRSEVVLRDGSHMFHTDGDGLLLSYEGPGGEVRVPKGVRYIGREAFAFCSQVTGIVLPEGVRRIDKKAFYKCGVRTVSLPETLTFIGELAFSDTPLERIDLPDQVTSLGEAAFWGASCLEAVRLPEGLTSLDPDMFFLCASLKEIALPRSLKYIQARAFMSCAGLESITLPEGLAAVWTEAFRGCTSLRGIFLGDSVEALGYDAFSECSSLGKVRIPKGLDMTHGNAFVNTGRIVLTGPGQATGLIINKDPEIYYDPELKKVTVPEGVGELPSALLQKFPDLEILDLPESLKLYSWSSFKPLRSLRRIVTDRSALAAEIALLLDLECVDREGRSFTFSVPERSGEWIFTQDDEFDGICLLGCRGEIGRTGDARYTTVIIPDTIDGKPVTRIGPGAFDGYDFADAFYIPDSVRNVERRAFGYNGFCGQYGRELFMRIPYRAWIPGNAFEGTRYFTIEKGPEEQPDASRRSGRADQATPGTDHIDRWAADAAEDPALGTGTRFHSALKPNIWQYFDRLSREDRIRELTHSFSVKGEIDGAGWATVGIWLDGEEARFRISYIGNSPADFRRFVEEIGDGESEGFGWSAEPGSFPWHIQRRGGILYVNAPNIRKSFFIPYKTFLFAVNGLTDEW